MFFGSKMPNSLGSTLQGAIAYVIPNIGNVLAYFRSVE